MARQRITTAAVLHAAVLPVTASFDVLKCADIDACSKHTQPLPDLSEIALPAQAHPSTIGLPLPLRLWSEDQSSIDVGSSIYCRKACNHCAPRAPSTTR